MKWKGESSFWKSPGEKPGIVKRSCEASSVVSTGPVRRSRWCFPLLLLQTWLYWHFNTSKVLNHGPVSCFQIYEIKLNLKLTKYGVTELYQEILCPIVMNLIFCIFTSRKAFWEVGVLCWYPNLYRMFYLFLPFLPWK